MSSILSNYDFLHQLWEDLLDVVKDVEIKSHIHGVSARMQSFDFLYGCY